MNSKVLAVTCLSILVLLGAGCQLNVIQKGNSSGLTLRIAAPVSDAQVSSGSGSARSINSSASSVKIDVFQGSVPITTGSGTLTLVGGAMVGSVTLAALPKNVTLSFKAKTFNGSTELDNVEVPYTTTSDDIQSLSISFNDPSVNLSNLTFSSGSPSPSFSPLINSYSVSSNLVLGSLSLSPTSISAGASIAVSLNGGVFQPVSSGSSITGMNTGLGTNQIQIKVTNTALQSKIYEVDVQQSGLKVVGNGYTFGTLTGTSPLGTMTGHSYGFTLTASGITLQQGTQISPPYSKYTAIKASSYSIQFTGVDAAFLNSESSQWTVGYVGAGDAIFEISDVGSGNYRSYLYLLPPTAALQDTYIYWDSNFTTAGGYTTDGSGYAVLPTTANSLTGASSILYDFRGSNAANLPSSGGTLSVQYFP